ncbi:MAG: transglutaminase domain-containing protein [Pseudomonadota bacterium]
MIRQLRRLSAATEFRAIAALVIALFCTLTAPSAAANGVDPKFRFLGADPGDRAVQREIRRSLINAFGDDYGLQFKRDGSWRVSGYYEDAELKRALEFVERRLEALLFQTCENGFCSLDLVRIVAETDDDAVFSSVVRNFTGSDRERAERIVNFVQRIPYRIPDDQFLPPQEVLRRNYGDCDSKSVLTAVLLRAAGIGDAVVFLTYRDHVNIGLDIKRRPGDLTIRAEGRTYVLAEPAGPAEWPIGRTDKGGERDFRSNMSRWAVAEF